MQRMYISSHSGTPSLTKGQMGAVRVMALDLVRTRKYIQQFYSTKTQLQAISLQIQTFSSNQAMADAMKVA